jgi:hypothetical protein
MRLNFGTIFSIFPAFLKIDSSNRASRHWVSVAKYAALPSFAFVCKLLRDL